jgi:transcriptional regulator GlxA family with amidase domain
MPIRPRRPIPRRIAVLAFDGISPFSLSSPCLVFGDDRTELGVPPFEVQVCAAEPGRLRTTVGFEIGTRHGLGALRRADVVIVPSWRVRDEPPPALLAALRAAHRRGALIVGLCLGAFLLAEAGLLDGRRATTHWHWAAEFRRRFPQVKLDPAVLYVDAGDVVTSAGIAGGLDCCLYLLRCWCGEEIANRVARRMVMSPHRRGGQAQFIERPLAESTRGTRMQVLLDWMREHLDEPLRLDDLAARAAMSRRTFTRQFQKATGSSVVQWLTHQRLGHASRLLESTDRAIEAVAQESGFGSAVSLRQHFVARYATSPLAYRRQFRAPATP